MNRRLFLIIIAILGVLFVGALITMLVLTVANNPYKDLSGGTDYTITNPPPPATTTPPPTTTTPPPL